MKKLMYLSCHSIAEYDEIRMFHDLGFEVYSHGSYVNPSNPSDPIRPALPQIEYHEWFGREAHDNPKDNMSKEFLEKFDIIFSHWVPGWIMNNIDKVKDKIWILRKFIATMSSSEVVELLVDKMKATKNNKAFFKAMNS